jgi:preprotein translocase subunit SecD
MTPTNLFAILCGISVFAIIMNGYYRNIDGVVAWLMVLFIEVVFLWGFVITGKLEVLIEKILQL